MRILILLFSLLSAAACSANPYVPAQTDDFFYVRNDGVDMPVWIMGNKNSDTMIVFLNGGPGGTVAGFWNLTSFSNLQKLYKMVYFDGRSTMLSVGSPGDDTVTPEQCAEDAKMIIQIVKKKYNPASIFLMGTSGGGMMGTVFLTNSTRQALVKGWIELDGAHNFGLSVKLSFEWCSNRAAQLQNDETLSASDRSDWKNAVAWYGAHSYSNLAVFFGMIPDDWMTHQGYVTKAGGYIFNETAAVTNELNKLSEGQQNSIGLYSAGVLRWYSLQIYTNDSSKNMGLITLPTLIGWGQNDGIIPVAMATNAYQAIGTPAGDKYLAIFTNSGHVQLIEEPERFVDVVTNFIEKYR